MDSRYLAIGLPLLVLSQAGGGCTAGDPPVRIDLSVKSDVRASNWPDARQPDVGGTCLPEVENCSNFLDDDCDGKIEPDDPDCQLCSPLYSTQACDTVLPGSCASGSQTCLVGKSGSVWDWTGCVPDLLPGTAKEEKGKPSCSDGIDNDCDGQSDAADDDCQDCSPGTSAACTTGLPGICNPGSKLCKGDGSWDVCTPTVTPGAQSEDKGTTSCENSLDDDCDGNADEADPDCHCSKNSDCPDSRACVSHLCILCVLNNQCEPGQACVDGACGGCSQPTDCEPGQNCVDGTCVDPSSNLWDVMRWDEGSWGF